MGLIGANWGLARLSGPKRALAGLSSANPGLARLSRPKQDLRGGDGKRGSEQERERERPRAHDKPCTQVIHPWAKSTIKTYHYCTINGFAAITSSYVCQSS